jgi:hypothetical protein
MVICVRKFGCRILPLLLLAFFAGCNFPGETGIPDDAVLPPVRIAEGTRHASMARSYTFSEAFSEAYLVARIRIGNWLSEHTGRNVTFYEATVLETYKGKEFDTIVLRQDGCSRVTMGGYPLFTYGDEMLVFLGNPELSLYDDAFWIIGAFTTLLYIETDKSGDIYAVDRHNILGQYMSDFKSYSSQKAWELYNISKRDDPLAAGLEEMIKAAKGVETEEAIRAEIETVIYPYIYLLSDLEAYFDSQK